MQIKASKNLRIINKSYNDGKRGVGLKGGTRSTKTVSIIQFIVLYCLRNRGKKIAICRDTMANLKRTTMQDLENICRGLGDFEGQALYPSLRINRHEGFTSINGNSIWFFGLKDDPMRVHGFDTDIFFINEIISTYKNTFDQLEQRCREFWLGDFNPSEPQSWVYKLELRPDVDFYTTTFEDNPFLPKPIIDKIKGYEPTEQNIKNGTADKKQWTIYGIGEVYKGSEVIFPDWDTYSEEPKGFDYVFYGLDWGWNDPLAFIKVTIDANHLYLRELLYGSEIEDSEYTDVILREPELTKQQTYLVCDNTEEKSRRALKRHGIPAIAAKKPAGSIVDGIKLIKRYQIHIHEDSVNIQREANEYKWKIDNKTDTVLDIPVDKHNHSWDAIRYPLYRFIK